MNTERTIRRSQAIQPYGPGAILDWGQECFVMLDTNNERWRRAPKIQLERLQDYLGVDCFHQPPVKIGYDHRNALPVLRFPRWLFCPRCNRLKKWTHEDERRLEDSRDRLPKCNHNDQHGRPCSGDLVPMRYVAVCENGHMTDVDWHRWAHANTSRHGTCAGRKELKFTAKPERGSSLSALQIECCKCGAANDLDGLTLPGSLKRIGQSCWGEQPWQSEGEDCAQDLRPLLRSQTAVHFSSIVSALDLRSEERDEKDEMVSRLRELIQLRLDTGDTTEDFTQKVCSKVANKVADEFGRAIDAELVSKLASEQCPDTKSELSKRGIREDQDWSSFLGDEWRALTTPNKRPGINAPLIVAESDWKDRISGDPILGELIRDVYLVERLREVRAFQGFRRLSSDGPLVHPWLNTDRPLNWLPGTEVYGEGIFLEFSARAISEWEEQNGEQLSARHRSLAAELADQKAVPSQFPETLEILARFVMVHTFSHLLMRQLCFECGYHAASIRERLYVFTDKAGILLYTADGDSEGSLGGLVRQGRSDRLLPTILAALRKGLWCSNDPICGELPPHGICSSNRGACHACALAPETSCTHINSLLDRKLVVSSQLKTDGGLSGFFDGTLDWPCIRGTI